MKKQASLKEVKSCDAMCMMAGLSILFCILTAVLGFESLSISGVMIFAVVSVLGCMMKGWVELCKELVEEE